MSDRVGDAVREYAELATSLADRWRKHLDDVQGGIDMPAYSAEQAISDLSATVILAAETCALLAYGAVDAVSTVAVERPQAATVSSETYSSQIAEASLTVTGPLVNYQLTDELPQAAVWCDPERLEAGKTDFVVRADASLRHAGLYAGQVLAEGDGGSEIIDVEILVA